MTIDETRVVAVGGGHGLAVTLAAVRPWATSVTAIVSVADDGASSGRLRRELGIIAPGDVRRCLQALAPGGLMTDAVGHRFARGELRGHPAGNVLLAGLLEQSDDPVSAIDALAAAMSVEGRVLPATIEPVDLVAATPSGRVVGQVAVANASDIVEIGWLPEQPRSPVPVIDAIESADLIVLGPGSLYTSVLAAVVPEVRAALVRATAPVLYVANLAPQRFETAGYDLHDHVAAVLRHGVEPDAVLADEAQVDDSVSAGVDVMRASLASDAVHRHDVDQLARAVERYAAVTVSPSQL